MTKLLRFYVASVNLSPRRKFPVVPCSTWAFKDWHNQTKLFNDNYYHFYLQKDKPALQCPHTVITRKIFGFLSTLPVAFIGCLHGAPKHRLVHGWTLFFVSLTSLHLGALLQTLPKFLTLLRSGIFKPLPQTLLLLGRQTAKALPGLDNFTLLLR